MEEESFASYILSQTDWGKKLEIMFYLKKKTNIYYNNAVIFKTLISKMFTEYLNEKNPEMNLDINLIITARLLCDCCKEDDITDKNEIQNYSNGLSCRIRLECAGKGLQVSDRQWRFDQNTYLYLG